jgi:hypothetical protein
MNQADTTYTLKDINGVSYIISTHLESIHGCKDFMTAIRKGSDKYYKTTMLRNGKVQKKVSALGAHLRMLSQYSKLYTCNRIYHPAIAFFLEEYRKHEISGTASLESCANKGDAEDTIDIFDDFVSTMRKRAKANKLNSKVSDWESKPKKNMISSLELEESLFETYARMVVIRLDLEYELATFSPDEIAHFINDGPTMKRMEDDWYLSGGDISTPQAPVVRVSFEQLQRDRKRLMTNFKGKTSLFEHLVGRISSIECSPHAGYHMHLVLFFNGAKVHKHEWLAQQIGEYWVNEITEGRGRFHNCNMAWDKASPLYGLGVINHDDFALRANLQKRVLPYLCKDDQSVDILPYKGCNTFSSGFTHRRKPKGNGRPRTLGVKTPDEPGSDAA